MLALQGVIFATTDRSIGAASAEALGEHEVAVAEPQHWEYVLLSGTSVPEHGPSSGKFSLAIAAWQRLPLWIANRIGPAVVRHLP